MHFSPLVLTKLQGRRIAVHDISLQRLVWENHCMVPLTDLLVLIEAFSRSGVRSIETIPILKGTGSGQSQRAFDVLSAASQYPGVAYAVSVDDVDNAESAVACGASEIRLAISASEIHNLKRAGRTVEESAYLLRDILQLAKGRALVDISIEAAFGCPLGSMVAEQDVLEIGDWLAHHGASRITLCDSAAKANPVQVERLCDGLPERWKELALCLQFHNGRSLALANVLAGLIAGIDEYKATLGGLDEVEANAPGMLCLEDVVHMTDAMGCVTGSNLGNLLKCKELLETML